MRSRAHPAQPGWARCRPRPSRSVRAALQGQADMAAVLALRGGLRGALLAQQQQRAWSSGSGADQVRAGRWGVGLGGRGAVLTARFPCSWASWAKAPGRAAVAAAPSARLEGPSARSRRPRRSATSGER